MQHYFPMFAQLFLVSALVAGSFSFRISHNCDLVPPLNKEVVQFVKSSIGKKVGRGECWDLAAQALNHAGAKWDGQFGFGAEVDPLKDCIYPGDVIQYTGVRVMYRQGNTYYEEQMDKHTAVVFQVKEKGSYIVAEQNTSKLGRKVGLNQFALANIKAGKVQFYRPGK